MVEKINTKLAPILPRGYVDWSDNQPVTKQEALVRLSQLGYIPTSSELAANAILDDEVQEKWSNQVHILLVYEVHTHDTQFGSAYQVWPLIQNRDKYDFVSQTFAGGNYCNAVFVVKEIEVESPVLS